MPRGGGGVSGPGPLPVAAPPELTFSSTNFTILVLCNSKEASEFDSLSSHPIISGRSCCAPPTDPSYWAATHSSGMLSGEELVGQKLH